MVVSKLLTGLQAKSTGQDTRYLQITRAACNSRAAALSLFDGHMEVWWVDIMGAIRGVALGGFWESRYHLTERGAASAAGSLIACAPCRRHPSDYIKSPPQRDGVSAKFCSGEGSLRIILRIYPGPRRLGGTRHGSKSEESTWRFTLSTYLGTYLSK